MADYKSIIDLHPNPCVIHINFKPLYANQAFAEFSGLDSVSEVLGLTSLKQLFVEEHWPEADRRYQQVMDSEHSSKPEVIEHTDMQGNPQLAEITDALVYWQGQKAMCTYISVVTDRIRREEDLHRMALCDELTGVRNRRYLLNQFENHHKPYLQGRHYLALIDLDYFKLVNDTWGHVVGDNLLKQVARALSDLFNTRHKLVRIGGEEFALILSADSEVELTEQLTLIQDTIRNACVQQEQRVCCTGSIGVTNYLSGDTFDAIFERADRALYKAKHLGRDQVVCSWGDCFPGSSIGQT